MRKLMSIAIVILLTSPLFGQEHPAILDYSINFLFGSAIETDFQQSLNWFYATAKHPRVFPDGSTLWEGNPIIAGTTYENFKASIQVTKYAFFALHYFGIPEQVMIKIKFLIALVETAVAIDSNIGIERFNLPRTWMVDFTIPL